MLSIGGPLVISFFLLIINASHYHGGTTGSDRHKLQYTWRILMGIGVIIPLSVFYFRLKMMNSKLYRRNALVSLNLQTRVDPSAKTRRTSSSLRGTGRRSSVRPVPGSFTTLSRSPTVSSRQRSLVQLYLGLVSCAPSSGTCFSRSCRCPVCSSALQSSSSE